ncbi:MAG TPA: metallopeptidase [Myxococcales bacterium]|nr:metallopeptidase [Myxococcales bacterium]
MARLDSRHQKHRRIPRFVPAIITFAILVLVGSSATAQFGRQNPGGQNGLRPIGRASQPSKGEARDIARSHLQRNRRALGFSVGDLDGFVLRQQHRSAKSGLTHLYFRQQIDGIDVEGADLVSAIDSEGRLLSQGDRLVRGLRGRIETRRPALSADAALLAAATELGLAPPASLEIRSTRGGITAEVVFEPSGISRDEIPAKLSFVVTDTGAIRIAWNVVIRTPDGRHWWNLFVDAETGTIVERQDWIARDSYNVFSPPLPSPDEGSRSLEINPANATASPFGWHDTNEVAGAEFTDTRGNNVHAQEDTDGNDTGGVRPDGGGSLVFDFPVNSTLHPSSYQSAAVANLFYWNNYLHDVLYQYGFDEAAGNFQENNYGNGGSAGDPVQADAQDGSDINNAQFGTPPDGFDPRMEMFLFTQLPAPSLQILTPAGIAGFYATSSGAFGAGTLGLTDSVILALDAADGPGPSTTDACSALTNAGAVAGNIAIADRGSCLFIVKVANVQAAGAIGIIIANNAGDALVNMGGTEPSLVIPALFVGQSDGTTIKNQLGAGVTATMITAAPRGSSFDNGILAHEYGHGLSNRLTGGAMNVSCLNNTQSMGMGEGWSDWLALMVTAENSDSAIVPVPIGTYALGQPTTGPGLRNHPYSRDLTLSPLTLADIVTLDQPHGVGEVWASALWDLYWNLLDYYGFDADLYAGTGGNNLLFQLVLDAMKIQACNPTFLQARDALLLADANANAGANECLIWEAFARRGIGFSATSGSSSTTTVSEAFDEPTTCQNECGNSTLQPGEQCDDGGAAFFDGCAANCRSESLLPAFTGIASGGTVTATIDGVVVQITTTPGQSANSIAAALAAAINANTALAALNDISAAQTNQVVITGILDSLIINDSGLNPAPVPLLGLASRGLLVLTLFGLVAGRMRSGCSRGC